MARGSKPSTGKTKSKKPAQSGDEASNKDLRVAECICLLSRRMKTTEIQVQLAAKYGVDRRTIRQDLRRARAELARASEKVSIEVRRANYRAGLDLLFQEALASKHYAAALGALDRISALDKLLEPGQARAGLASGVLVVPATVEDPEQWLAMSREAIQAAASSSEQGEQ